VIWGDELGATFAVLTGSKSITTTVDPTADTITGFKNGHIATGRNQSIGRGQSSETRSNHNNATLGSHPLRLASLLDDELLAIHYADFDEATILMGL
jgi:hypothetical protein